MTIELYLIAILTVVFFIACKIIDYRYEQHEKKYDTTPYPEQDYCTIQTDMKHQEKYGFPVQENDSDKSSLTK